MGQSPFDVEGKMPCQMVCRRQPPAVALWQSAVRAEWTYHQHLSGLHNPSHSRNVK